MTELTGCFDATARAFKEDRLTFEEFIDINLRHFSGERHGDEDRVNTDEDLAQLSWQGNIGRVSAAMKVCILEPKFIAPHVESLRPILLACAHDSFQALTSLDDKSILGNSFILQIALLIAIQFENNALAKLLIDTGLPPPRCIFHLQLGSIRGQYDSLRAIDRGVLAHLVRRGWAIPDHGAVLYAVQSPDAVSGIELFQAIIASGFQLDKPAYDTSLPILAAAYSKPELLHHILAHFSIPPDPDLILVAVRERKSGGADMLRYLMDRAIDVNHTKASKAAYGWSPTAGHGGYGDPRARAEAEWAQSTASQSSGGSGTALHLAAENGNLEAVRVLVDRGARKNIKDAAGRTPAQRVKQENRDEILKMLSE